MAKVQAAEVRGPAGRLADRFASGGPASCGTEMVQRALQVGGRASPPVGR